MRELPPPAAARQQLESRTILTIDDDRPTRASLVMSLMELGFRVLEAADGRTGLDILKQQNPDLVLLDLHMPDLSGTEVLRRIHFYDPELPVIVISGTGEIEDVVEALRNDAWDFLCKPIKDLAILQHTIEKALERARLKRENRAYQIALEEQITSRTRALEDAYEQLAESEQRYRQVFENLQDAYFETSLEGEVLAISPAIARIMGLTAEEMLHTNIAGNYRHPQQRQKLLETLKTRRQVVDYEIEIVNATGGLVPCSLNASLVFDSTGEPLKITGALRDISQRKTGENRLRQSNQTLEALFDAAPLGIMAVDTGYRMTLWNKTAEQMFGWTRAEIIGQPYPLAAPGKEAEALVDLARALAGDQFRGREGIRQGKDGQLLEVCASTAPLRDNNDDISGLMLIVEDISEKRRLRSEADRTNRLASLGELAAGVAHEINNPNGLMLLNLPTLRELVADALALQRECPSDHTCPKLGGLSPQRAAEAFPQLLDELEDGAKRIKQIVDDLKDFARQDAGHIAVSFDLNESLQKALRLAGNHLKKATDHCHLLLQEDLPQLLGTPQRIEQVLVNLLVNACEALTDRGQAITILTSYERANQQVLLCISDEGSGIAAEDLPHVTDPFFTTRRETGGTGLGLSVSARIIKEHGGALAFSSEPDRGTRASISLPVATQAQYR